LIGGYLRNTDVAAPLARKQLVRGRDRGFAALDGHVHQAASVRRTLRGKAASAVRFARKMSTPRGNVDRLRRS